MINLLISLFIKFDCKCNTVTHLFATNTSRSYECCESYTDVYALFDL